MKNTIATLLVAVSTFAVAANANAENSFKPYVGIDYNYSNADYSNFNTGSVNVGTQYNDYFSTEVFYQKSDDDVNTAEDLRQGTRNFDAYGIDFNGYLPMGCEQEYALIGSVGIGEYQFNTGYNVYADLNEKDHGVGYRVGVGGLYNVTNNVAIKAMARYVSFDNLSEETDEDEMMEYTAGIRYNF